MLLIKLNCKLEFKELPFANKISAEPTVSLTLKPEISNDPASETNSADAISVSFGSCQGSTSPTTSPTSSPTLSPTDSEGCSDWYFVQNNGNTRDCSWIGSKPDKRCNRNGGFGECIVGTKCYNNPIYTETPSCPRMRAYIACPNECA